MYRNWSARIPSGPSIGLHIAGTPRIGWLGSEITAATGEGTLGPGIFGNDGIVPTSRYRALLVSSTFPAWALTLFERGDGLYTAPGTAQFDLLEDGVLYGRSVLQGSFQELRQAQSSNTLFLRGSAAATSLSARAAQSAQTLFLRGVSTAVSPNLAARVAASASTIFLRGVSTASSQSARVASSFRTLFLRGQARAQRVALNTDPAGGRVILVLPLDNRVVSARRSTTIFAADEGGSDG